MIGACFIAGPLDTMRVNKKGTEIPPTVNVPLLEVQGYWQVNCIDLP